MSHDIVWLAEWGEGWDFLSEVELVEYPDNETVLWMSFGRRDIIVNDCDY
jgi:hypothetical protein